jgi:prepilin-type N-terminal cleavage/methylation domain-containing protein
MKKLFQRTATSARRAGFTLLEMLVVIGITTLLSVVAIGYSKAGQNEVALTVETSKIAEVVLQAKELAINTYGVTQSGSKACAFGVHFDLTDTPQTYSLFAYSVPVGTPCPTLASTTDNGLTYSVFQEYEPSSWNIPVAQGVVMQGRDFAPDVLTDVLFYPPAPTTLMSRDDTGEDTPSADFMLPPATSNIYLSTTDGKNSSVISVSPEGQVTF